MPVPKPSRPLRILQLTDSHLFEKRDSRLLKVDTDASFRGVIDYIVQHDSRADAVLATGDIAQDGSAGAYARFLELAQPLAPTVIGLPGNHDANDMFYRVWDTHAHGITDIGAWRLLMLDSSIPRSSAGHVAPDQMAFLQQALSTAGNRHVLVAVHHNPVPVGSPWLDSMMIDNGHELLGLLKRFPNTRGLVWGHVHQEFDTVYNFGLSQSDTDAKTGRPGDASSQDDNDARRDMVQRHLRLLATPSTCVQFTPGSTTFSLDMVDPGYRWLELHDDGRINTHVVRVPGLGLRPDMESSGY